jgi:CheY-like chemotaxis protein
VQLDLAPSLWPVEVDSTQLETALLNAAFNARDAMPDGGSITLSTANRSDADGDWVCISLRDTGEGMSDEVKARVFEPFFTTKPVGKGTGLGLSQIHGFAAQSGGRAEIDTRLGEGTTIRLLLPRTGKSAAPAGGTPQAAEPSRTLKVLLVEDNEHVREFAATLLEDLGHRVVQADEAESALSILAREPVDILFSDVVMPGMSGVELARRARAHRPELPVLLASGYSDEIIAGAGAEFDFVHKPYDAQQLGLALSAAFEWSAGTR